MPSFAYLTIANQLRCQAGTQAIYGRLGPEDLFAANDVMAVEDQESLTFKVSRLDRTGTERAIRSQYRAGRVVTVLWSDGSFDEWRIGAVTLGRGENGRDTVTCVPLWLDTIERADTAAGKGWVSDLVAGVRNYVYEITQKTASQIFTQYLFTPPNLPSWITLGTVDPTYVIPTLSVSRLRPGELAIAVRDALRAVDVACELRLRRNGTTDYKLDLVTQIGASGATPIFHPATSLLAVQQKTDPTLQATRILMKGASNPDGNVGSLGYARFRVGTPSGNTFPLTDRNGGASPIAFDNQWVGDFVFRPKTGRTFAITSSDSVAGTVTCSGGISTLAADEDIEFRLDEPLTNTRTTTTRYAVSAVPDGTHITCGVSAPISVDGQYTDWYARAWSLASGGVVIATTRITTTVAATDILTVASSAGVTNSHFIEFIQLDGAGECPDFVDHPTYIQADPIGYGLKVMELGKPQAGVMQLANNAWMRTWSNSANPPDGWTAVATSAFVTFAQNSSAAFTRYGGFSYHITGNISGALGPITITAPPVYPNSTPGQAALSARAFVYFVTFAIGVSSLYGSLTVCARTASGSAGAVLGEVRIYSSAPSPAPGVDYAIISTGQWIELAIHGITLGPTTAPYGVVGIFTVSENSPVTEFYLDAIELYPFANCPNDATEFGDAPGLLQAGNNQLRLVASPPVFYSFSIRDLERAFPTEYARLAVTLGANARAVDTDYGIDTTVRVLRIERNLKNETETTLTLANKPTNLSTLLATSAATTARVISAVNAAQNSTTATGPAFATVTGTPTLPENTEIAISSGSGSVSLGPNSAITFNPGTSASPKTGVTAGTPPSRFRPPNVALF
jgi:hypothetical protein